MKYIETQHVLDITNLPEPLQSKVYKWARENFESLHQNTLIDYEVGSDDEDWGDSLPELDDFIKEHHPDITSFVIHYWW